MAVGTHRGYVQVWDVMANKRVNVLEGHTARVGALAWNGDNLSSGSRDRMIRQRDVRTPPLASERCLGSHRQEVCGLKWSPDNQYLASGGNDNKLFVWNTSSNQPVHAFTEHLAAVKAIAWSPHHHGLLASGGGTADRCIRFWNTLTGQVGLLLFYYRLFLLIKIELSGNAIGRYWKPSVQFSLVQTLIRISFNSRILTESDFSLEISQFGAGNLKCSDSF